MEILATLQVSSRIILQVLPMQKKGVFFNAAHPEVSNLEILGQQPLPSGKHICKKLWFKIHHDPPFYMGKLTIPTAKTTVVA